MEDVTRLSTREIKLIHRFPRALEFLRDRKLWMSSLVLLAPVIDEKNADALMEEAAGLSTDEVEKLVPKRRRSPRPLRSASARGAIAQAIAYSRSSRRSDYAA